MVRVRAGNYRFKVQGVEIEGEDEPGVNVQYPWEDVPRRFHEKDLQIKAFFIDKYPVSNRSLRRSSAPPATSPKMTTTS